MPTDAGTATLTGVVSPVSACESTTISLEFQCLAEHGDSEGNWDEIWRSGWPMASKTRRDRMGQVEGLSVHRLTLWDETVDVTNQENRCLAAQAKRKSTSWCW
jgi:hypothetical protein